MPAVEVSHVRKAYADKVAVDDLSFTVEQGEVFGLIGPNGAGKTTTLRMMMDIVPPDRGGITVLGEKLGEASKNRLGYLPEERGLYKKLSVLETITYLASLKGLGKAAAQARAETLLREVGLLEARRKKIDELSKGMGQLVQFIVTIVHDPELVVLDEPMSGLDPVNTELIKDMLRRLRSQGKAVVLSTHQMNQVEALCDRILMVDRGRAVLYGRLAEIKAAYRSNAVTLDYEGTLPLLAGVTPAATRPGHAELTLAEGTAPPQVLRQLVEKGVRVTRFEVGTPSLNEIFLKVAGGSHA